jgi:NADPH:quinone reductase-like Zn-dependent oxidoreductase
VGLAAVQIGKACGAVVIAVARYSFAFAYFVLNGIML